MNTTKIAYKLFQKGINYQYEIHSRRRWKRKNEQQTLRRSMEKTARHFGPTRNKDLSMVILVFGFSLGFLFFSWCL
jgi:hypothetical protein